jgi:D-alanyl-D-alanine carboxypeptidase
MTTDPTLTRLREYFEQYAQAYHIPGLAVAVTDREKTLHTFHLGYADVAARAPVTPDTLFEIGSISKSFTALALLQLQEAGRVDLHAPVTRYLPWFEVRSRFAPITLHHLLTHTAGLTYGQDCTPTGFSEVWALRDTEAGASPGTFFHYSNSGYKTLGLVLEAVTGLTCGEVVRQRVLEPLGMSATDPVITHDTRRRLAVGYSPLYDDRPAPRAAPLAPALWLETETGDGAIASTADDMAAYVRLLLNGGRGPQGRLLSEASFAQWTQSAIQAEEAPHETYYGYGLDISQQAGHACLGHTGGMVGYMAAMLADMEAGLGVIVLASGRQGVKETAQAALRILQGQAADDLTPAEHVEKAEEYAGTYRSGERSLTVEAEAARLYLRHGGERITLEAATGDDQFHVLHPDFDRFLLRFGREAGRVVEAFYGSDWYAGEGYTGPAEFDSPAEWQGYVGHYRAHNPWYSNFRVVLRKGALALIYPEGNEEPLVPLEDGSFRVGEDERLPERMRFGLVLDGRAEQANLNGGLYYRTFTP